VLKSVWVVPRVGAFGHSRLQSERAHDA